MTAPRFSHRRSLVPDPLLLEPLYDFPQRYVRSATLLAGDLSKRGSGPGQVTFDIPSNRSILTGPRSRQKASLEHRQDDVVKIRDSGDKET